MLLSGIDPGQKRKAENAAQSGEGSFEAVAREWFEKKKGGWAASHSEKIIARLENDVFPWLGTKPVNQVTAPDLLMVVRRIEERGAVDTAHRALQNCDQVFRYAIVTGRAERNPAADLHGALKPIRKEHFPTLTDPKDVAALIRDITAYEGSFVVRCALKLTPLFFMRPGELRNAEWQWVDFERNEIRYHVSKTRTDHIVPLARQYDIPS